VRMLYRSYTPAPPLADHVEYLWSLSDAPAHQRESIVPTGTLELVINLHEDELRIYQPDDTIRCRRLSGAVVSGAYRGCFVIDTREHASVMGAHFKPGGALPFLSVPPGTLSDTHVDLETLWGTRARTLRERLCSAGSAYQRFRLLEQALLLARGSLERRGAVRVAIERLGRGFRVGEIASDLGLSRRRFIEVFTAEVGMTPKLFGRVQRFQRALSLARGAASRDWSELALDCRYFDQSHMIRDFVALSGFSPAELVRRGGENVKDHHVALGGTGGSNSSNTRRDHGRIVSTNS
jgi:AraC-like DNA-binding protein